jgi:uncharacterized membrane protein YeaQ/YmgE (transglycosylase-associated protein family)
MARDTFGGAKRVRHVPDVPCTGDYHMLDPLGFWSYARQDDAQSDGQLSQLRAIVGKAIVLQHGTEVMLWQNISAIPYGADWAETIERTINQTTFFVPIVTPRFLKSTHCREEFLAFRRQMQNLNRSDLIFPIHYVGVDDVKPEETVFGEELTALRRSQWIDFRPLFYSDLKSPEVRRWAGEVAASVLKTLRRPLAAQPRREPEPQHRSAAEDKPKSADDTPRSVASNPMASTNVGEAQPTSRQGARVVVRGGGWPTSLLIAGAVAIALGFPAGGIIGTIIWIILGLIVGFIASKVVKRTGSGIATDLILGTIGAIGGGVTMRLLVGLPGIDIISIMVATIGAVGALWIYYVVVARS